MVTNRKLYKQKDTHKYMKIRDTNINLGTLISLGLAVATGCATPAPTAAEFQKPEHCYEIDNESDLFCNILDLVKNPSLINTSRSNDIYVKMRMGHKDIQRAIKTPELLVSENSSRTETLYDSWGRLNFNSGETGYLRFERETGKLTGVFDRYHQDRTEEFDINTFIDHL